MGLNKCSSFPLNEKFSGPSGLSCLVTGLTYGTDLATVTGLTYGTDLATVTGLTNGTDLATVIGLTYGTDLAPLDLPGNFRPTGRVRRYLHITLKNSRNSLILSVLFISDNIDILEIELIFTRADQHTGQIAYCLAMFKGTVQRDFRPPVFFLIQTRLGH